MFLRIAVEELWCVYIYGGGRRGEAGEAGEAGAGGITGIIFC